MKKKLNWDAFSSHKRIVAIEEIKQVINKNGGYIINFQMFSDLAMSLSIEIEEKQILVLHTELQKIISLAALGSTIIDQNSKKEWMILMNISFSDGSGNMKHEIINQ